MKALPSDLRKQLAKTVLSARGVAETGARKALEALAVHEPEPYKHLNEQQRLLRRALRAQARQLGDEESQAKRGAYDLTHLQEKTAYDQWHRLLFARFLIENNLLLSPEHGVAVSLADCEELAPTLGLSGGWAVAARFAATELPEMFRADDPAGQIELPVEDRKQLIELVTALPAEVFLSDDSLGWVYQFWQAQRKDEVNESGTKIGADELAPVTQLFTEDYMVLFLLHNTLGAWWAGKLAQVDLSRFKVEREEDARQAAALPGIDWTYLRFVRSETPSPGGEGAAADPSPGVPIAPQNAMGHGEGKGKGVPWTPAAGTFDGWPKTAKELRVLDPCMGSGHFLVAELPILMAMRMAEEGLTKEEAIVAVLRDNLYGLELDARCSQIAAFNLAMAAWKLAGYQKLPPLNLACSGLAPRAKLEAWTKLANGDERLRQGMDRLYHLFKDGPTLGSLINPRKLGGDLLTAEFHNVQPLLQKALEREAASGDEAAHELVVTAKGLAQAGEILSSQFTLVATNVPYLGRGKQDEKLKDYCERIHPEAKADLATCFVERCLDFCSSDGTASLVTPQNWLFLSSYTTLRKRLLGRSCWNIVAKLGANAFQDMNWWAAITMLMALTRAEPSKNQLITGCDAGAVKDQSDKALLLEEGPLKSVSQASQLNTPNHAITFEDISGQALLSHSARSIEGLSTGDGDRFLRKAWELPHILDGWDFFHVTPDETVHYGGLSEVIFWQHGSGELSQSEAARVQGHYAWGKKGVLVSKMNRLKCCMYFGMRHDKMSAAIVPENEEIIPAVWAFCSSENYQIAVRSVSQKVDVATNTLIQVPFNLSDWQRVAAKKYPDGLPKPFSADPTQWLFNGHPTGADHPLQVAVARLLGYRWPRQTGSSFPDCPALGPDGLESFADADGIVCISAIKGEAPAAERLRSLLAVAYGSEWSAAKQTELLAQVDYAGSSLEDWLRNGFFEQHCGLFHHRPFIWHIWDGRKDGFSALVNYHQLTRSNLEKLTYSYLGDWIRRQQAAVDGGEAGSDARLQAAKDLQAELVKILEGEKPYDIFVRWKPLDQQPIGWEPDVNDGVRLNIRPFMSARDVAKKGAGILRSKPNINWNKDRGTDVPTAPWFKIFKGERINDHHLTLDEKRKARHSSGEPGSARQP
jgi:hypothetical protein